jgi:predicted AlkP superfamily phosphohydrolase/phosphomutase
MAVDTKSTRLVILGIDAGDPDFIERWAQQGYLPTIASMMQRGCWGRTVGWELVTEVGVWLSLLSGVSRVQHGYYDFRQLNPGTYDLQIFTARDAKALPFWSCFLGREESLARR